MVFFLFKMHQKLFSAGAPPRTQLGELTTIPQTLKFDGEGTPRPHTPPLDA